MKATVSQKGQVTIPKPLRRRLGLDAGAVLDFQEERGRLVATKTSGQDPVRRVFGILKLRGGTEAAMRTLRGPAGTK